LLYSVFLQYRSSRTATRILSPQMSWMVFSPSTPGQHYGQMTRNEEAGDIALCATWNPQLSRVRRQLAVDYVDYGKPRPGVGAPLERLALLVKQPGCKAGESQVRCTCRPAVAANLVRRLRQASATKGWPREGGLPLRLYESESMRRECALFTLLSISVAVHHSLPIAWMPTARSGESCTGKPHATGGADKLVGQDNQPLA
jgi:hypothetical protein